MQKQIDSSLYQSIETLNRMRTWCAGWNGYDVTAPNPEAIDFTISKLPEVYGEFLSCVNGWKEPHVTATPEGDVHIMWYNEEKLISLYFSSNGIQYIKSWGADIVNQMEDGDANTFEDRVKLWMWLVNGKNGKGD